MERTISVAAGAPVGPFEARQGVRAARRAGAVVDAAARVGAAPVEGPTFFVLDPTALFRRALAAAFIDARGNATQLAQAAGLALGRPISIRDSAFQGPLGSSDEGLALERRAAAPAPPTRPGRSVISATVFVIFEAR